MTQAPIDRAGRFSVRELAQLHADGWTAPFWEAAREERLVSCACSRCGAMRMPPGPMCPVCSATEVTWQTLSGRGTVFTFTVARHAVTPQVREHLPYVIAVVDLDDTPDVRLIANVWDVPIDDVRIGMRVEVRWDHLSADVCIPRFVPLDEEENSMCDKTSAESVRLTR